MSELQLSVPFKYFVNICYYLFTSFGSLAWFFYSEHVQDATTVKNKKTKFISIIPMLVLIFLVLTTAQTKYIFYIDDSGAYVRGSLHIVQELIGYGYMMGTSMKALIKALRKRNYTKRREYLTLSSFAIFPLIFGILQSLFNGGAPMLCVGITVAVQFIYMSAQQALISLDPLTRLNNRNQLLRHLSGKMRHYAEGQEKSLYLLMMDADSFKHINDQYGHAEGDTALVRIADTLKYIARRDFFIARYGGDEFIMICEVEQEQEIRDVCQSIHAELHAANQAAHTAYDLDVSIGYARYQPDITTIPDFIKCADEELYRVKKAKKSRMAGAQAHEK